MAITKNLLTTYEKNLLKHNSQIKFMVEFKTLQNRIHHQIHQTIVRILSNVLRAVAVIGNLSGNSVLCDQFTRV